MSKTDLTRRGVLRSGAIGGAGLALPTIFTASSASAFTNEPTGDTVTLGFNVPQTGPYADEGADELRAYELAVEHLNGGGDGGMINTFSSKALEGTVYQGPTGEETVRAADHQVLKDYYLLEGKSASEMQDEDDFAEIISSGKSFPDESSLDCTRS